MFKGSIVALLTPFQHQKVDFAALERLVAWHIDQGTQGLVVCGSTGEAMMLEADEHQQIIETAVQVAAKRIPIIAGTGVISTRQTIELSQRAERAGADGLLIVTPPYVKPTQEGLIQHFKTIHDNTNVPIILYNNPGRAVVTLNVETVFELAKLPRIVGIKDSTGDLDRPVMMRQHLGPDFALLCGEDNLTLPYMMHGGDGVINVTGNIAPKLMREMMDAWHASDATRFKKARETLIPIAKMMFVEGNPVPVKYAAWRLGLCANEVRPPLLPLSATFHNQMDQTLAKAGLTPAQELQRAHG
ncbi:MAG: 4-hydroxy-tetrahydrodipicolinate synthase [Holosporales bacterium]